MASLWDIAPGQRDCGSAVLTSAASLIWKAQQSGEPAAWISARASCFFPPDLDAGGIDLAALVVVRAADASRAARAADKLLRSGAFGLVILDLGPHAAVAAPLLGRLLGLAQKHHAAVVFLTEKAADAPSLAPLVSLRVTASRRHAGTARFACTMQATKDKRRTPGWTCEETFRGPPGLR
ncbi:MAG: recombinase A [Candidatus Binatia bacterium]